MDVYVVTVEEWVVAAFMSEREASRYVRSFRSKQIAAQRKWNKAHDSSEGWQVSSGWFNTMLDWQLTSAGYRLPEFSIWKVPVSHATETDLDPSVRIVAGWAH